MHLTHWKNDNEVWDPSEEGESNRRGDLKAIGFQT